MKDHNTNHVVFKWVFLLIKISKCMCWRWPENVLSKSALITNWRCNLYENWFLSLILNSGIVGRVGRDPKVSGFDKLWMSQENQLFLQIAPLTTYYFSTYSSSKFHSTTTSSQVHKHGFTVFL